MKKIINFKENEKNIKAIFKQNFFDKMLNRVKIKVIEFYKEELGYPFFIGETIIHREYYFYRLNILTGEIINMYPLFFGMNFSDFQPSSHPMGNKLRKIWVDIRGEFSYKK